MASDVWQALAVLCEPRRREVYEHVAGAVRPVTRDDVSAALGMSRSLAAFHLEKLAAAGFLDYTFAQAPRTGIRATVGRRSKYYEVSQREIELSIPPRHYDVVGGILATALASGRGGTDPVSAARRLAKARGRALGKQFAEAGRTSTRKTMAALQRALAHFGYGPVVDKNELRLNNCPFRAMSEVAPDVVCAVNENFVRGLLEGIDGDPSVIAERCDHEKPGCCVLVRS